jgi:hypothetical protein
MPETLVPTTLPSPPAPSFEDPVFADDAAESVTISSNAYVIEVRGQTAGIVARDGQGFRFHASAHRFNALDGRHFKTPREAERAALRLIDPRMRQRPALRGRFALALS